MGIAVRLKRTCLQSLWGNIMAVITDILGNTYDPLYPSIQNSDGKVFQVLVLDQETGDVYCDMEATVALARQA